MPRRGRAASRRGRLVDEKVRARILARDQQCLACGEKRRKLLQIDHVVPNYFRLDLVDPDLQVLCRTCNQRKGLDTIDFHGLRPKVNKAQAVPVPAMPDAASSCLTATWEQLLRREANFCMRCGAVKDVRVGVVA